MASFDRVLVVGVGLIGASWARGLRRAGFNGPILGFDVVPRNVGAFDSFEVGLPQDVREGDLVVLCTPVSRIIEILRGPARDWTEGATITDCGSTKRAVCDAAKGLKATFVGGHPLAGSEQSGPEASRDDLFDGARYFLCGEHAWKVVEIVALLGTKPELVTPDEHDRMVALSSHLPQLVSSALAATVARSNVVGGPGLESMTRLASSSWSVWRDILMTNADALDAPLAAMIAELEHVRESLRGKNYVALEVLFASHESHE